MSETTNGSGTSTTENLADVFGLEKITVTRHDVPWDYQIAKMRKRSQTDPDNYGFVPVKPTVWDDDLKNKWLQHVGVEALVPISFTRVRAISSNVTDSSVIEVGDRAGEFSEQAFIDAMTSEKFSLRGETKSELEDELAELESEMIAIAKDKTIAQADRMVKFTDIAQRMGEIKEALEVKARESKPRGPRKKKDATVTAAPAAA